MDKFRIVAISDPGYEDRSADVQLECDTCQEVIEYWKGDVRLPVLNVLATEHKCPN